MRKKLPEEEPSGQGPFGVPHSVLSPVFSTPTPWALGLGLPLLLLGGLLGRQRVFFFLFLLLYFLLILVIIVVFLFLLCR
jgi:hypothetical protein